MITTLAKMGATHRISVLLDYQGGAIPESVTATILFEGKEDSALDIKPIQISGPIEEVEKHLASDFAVSVKKIEALVTQYGEAEADLAKQVEEKKAEAAKKKEEPKPEPKKPKAEKPKPAEPAKAVTSIADKAKPVPALTPAWKKPDAPSEPAAVPTSAPAEPAKVVAEDDLDSFFEENKSP